MEINEDSCLKFLKNPSEIHSVNLSRVSLGILPTFYIRILKRITKYFFIVYLQKLLQIPAKINPKMLHESPQISRTVFNYASMVFPTV